MIQTDKTFSTKMMTRVAMMSILAVVLMQFQTPIAFLAPSFIKLDISDMPGLITGFAMGPIAGILVQLLKNLFDLVVSGTETGGVGELSNFIIGSAFVLSSSTIYKKHASFKGAILSLIVGIFTFTLVATLSNYFIIFPLYSKIGIPMENIIKAGAAINPKIDTLFKMIIYTIVPFNLVKSTLTSIVTILLYKRIRPILKSE